MNNGQAYSLEEDQLDARISTAQSQTSTPDTASVETISQENDAGDEVFTVAVNMVACDTTMYATRFQRSGEGLGLLGGCWRER
jgi:hypothetical protein